MITKLNLSEKERQLRIKKIINSRLFYSNINRNEARKNKVQFSYRNDYRIVLDKLKKELNQCQQEYLFSCQQIGTAHRLAQLICKLEKSTKSIDMVKYIDLLIKNNNILSKLI